MHNITSEPSHQVETVTVDASDVAPVAYIRVKEASLCHSITLDEPPPLAIPLLLDDKWEEMISADAQDSTNRLILPVLSSTYRQQNIPPLVISKRATRSGSWLSVSNVLVDQASLTIEDECTSCWEGVRSE